MGYFLLFESMLDSVLFARAKYLKHDGAGKCVYSSVRPFFLTLFRQVEFPIKLHTRKSEWSIVKIILSETTRPRILIFGKISSSKFNQLTTLCQKMAFPHCLGILEFLSNHSDYNF